MKALFMHASAQQGFEIDYRSYILINCAILVVEMNSYSLQVVASHGLQFIK
jgi:hypothetical protein